MFTSVNGVSNYFEVLASRGKDLRDLKGKKIIAIGEKTSEELLKYNLRPDYMPAVYTAEGIISLAEKLNLDGRKILIPRAREKEVILAEENGYIALGLGKRILRAEAASLVSLELLSPASAISNCYHLTNIGQMRPVKQSWSTHPKGET